MKFPKEILLLSERATRSCGSMIISERAKVAKIANFKDHDYLSTMTTEFNFDLL